MAVNERMEWVAEILSAAAGEQILEIGCGAGIAVGLIASRLQSGKITGIDRSKAMIASATKRNRKFIDSGLAELICADLANAPLRAGTYQKVFAFNVNFLRKDIPNGLDQVRDVLVPEGKLFLFHQQPPMRSEASATEHEDNLIVALEAAGFVILDRLQKEMSPAPSRCIVSERLR